MTSKIGQKGQLIIPKSIRASRGIRLGDSFEALTDDDDVNLILLRRIRRHANAGLVEHLRSCPDKEPLARPMRRP